MLNVSDDAAKVADSKSREVARLAWYLLLTNIGIVVAAATVLSDILSIPPDDCPHRYFIVDRLYSVEAVLAITFIGICCGVLSLLLPTFDVLLGRPITFASIFRRIEWQVRFCFAAAIVPFLLAVIIFYNMVTLTPRDGEKRWESYVSACAR